MSDIKGALSLIADYGVGDLTDDDEVPGPRVSTKRTRRNSCEEQTQHRKLPVPDLFLTTRKDESCFDNPDEHNGRIRSFPHERGNWATFLYIPFAGSCSLDELLSTVRSKLNFDMNLVDDLHISVSKTVILKHHWIESFTDSVRKKATQINKFLLMFDCLRVYCNEERTRTFIGLHTKTGYDSLCKIVNTVDSCLNEFKLSNFYEDPSFHMSVLWCVGDKEVELNAILPDLNQIFNNIMSNTPQEDWFVYVTNLHCKSGNKCFSFYLL